MVKANKRQKLHDEKKYLGDAYVLDTRLVFAMHYGKQS